MELKVIEYDIGWQWVLTKPLIAAVNAACAGIAVALAAFCDLRFGAAALQDRRPAQFFPLDATHVWPSVYSASHDG